MKNLLQEEIEKGKEFNMKIRESNFELLRIISILCIIIFHFTYHSNVHLPLGTETRFIVDVTYMLGELGVNIFILISGYFCIKFKTKKAILLIMEILFYFTIILGILYHFNLINIPADIFSNFIGDWWFITCYMVLYFVSPFINNLLNFQDKKTNKKMIYTLLIIFCILPTFIGLYNSNTEEMGYYNRFIWMVIIYILGGYIRKYGLKRYENFGKALVNFIISSFLIILSIITITILKLNISSYYFWTPNNILMLYTSVSMFMVFKNLKIKNNVIINKIASTTLGIYILHDGISRKYIWKFIDNTKIISNLSSMFFLFFKYVIIIFILGVLIDIIRQYIFKFSVEKLIDKLLNNEEMKK